jgi:hypothetical protein
VPLASLFLIRCSSVAPACCSPLVTERPKQGLAEDLSLALLVTAQILPSVTHELLQLTPKASASLIHDHVLSWRSRRSEERVTVSDTGDDVDGAKVARFVGVNTAVSECVLFDVGEPRKNPS